MRNYHSGGSVGAFLAGALIGGAIALLFAPRPGAETRSMIRDYVDDEVDMLKERAAAARDYVEDEIDRYKRKGRKAASSRVEDLIEEAKEKVEEAREKVAKEIGAIKKTVKRHAPHIG